MGQHRIALASEWSTTASEGFSRASILVVVGDTTLSAWEPLRAAMASK
jgi:hypothetical protein